MNEIESKVIDSFIIKEKRDRYQFLLGNVNERRRGEGVNRLNHCKDLDPRFVHWLSGKVNIAELLRKEGSPDQVYVITLSEEIDGHTFPLEEALRLVTEDGWGAIVSCIPGRLAYYYDEEGSRKALLKREM